MDKKKLVLPGDHLLSCEEAEPGENTYTENDEIYSASFGEGEISEGRMSVKRKGKSVVQPHVGMELYCMVSKSSPNKAICTCVSTDEIEGRERSVEMTAVLPVSAVKKGYVARIEDVLRIGDIIKARISKITKTGIDISMVGKDCGVIYARPRRRRTYSR